LCLNRRAARINARCAAVQFVIFPLCRTMIAMPVLLTKPEQVEAAQRIVPVVSVQNRYNVNDRSSEPVLDLCTQEALAFLPWAPIQETEKIAGVLNAAKRLGVSERQVALAWLLARSPQILPIPGSGSPEHVTDNIAAAGLELTGDEFNAITDSIETRS